MKEPKLKVEKKPKDEVVVEKIVSEFLTDEEILKNHTSFRGSGGNGISYHKNIPINWDVPIGENVVWKLEIPLHGYNSPIICEDKIFVSVANSTQREVYCIHRII